MIMISSLSPSRLKGCCTASCCAHCNAADLSWIVYDILNLGQSQRYRLGSQRCYPNSICASSVVKVPLPSSLGHGNSTPCDVLHRLPAAPRKAPTLAKYPLAQYYAQVPSLL